MYWITRNGVPVEEFEYQIDAIRAIEAWEEMQPDSVFELEGEE